MGLSWLVFVKFAIFKIYWGRIKKKEISKVVTKYENNER